MNDLSHNPPIRHTKPKVYYHETSETQVLCALFSKAAQRIENHFRKGDAAKVQNTIRLLVKDIETAERRIKSIRKQKGTEK